MKTLNYQLLHDLVFSEYRATLLLEAEQSRSKKQTSGWFNLSSLPQSSHTLNFDITDEKFKIGRAEHTNQIVIDEPLISKKHCEFEKTNVGFYLHDTSRNGCWVNHVKVGEGNTVQLQHGDVIHLYADTKRCRSSLEMVVSFMNGEVVKMRRPKVVATEVVRVN